MKSQPKQDGSTMFYVTIEREENVEVTREADPNDDTYKHHTINGYKLVGDKDMWDFIIPFDPAGKAMYLVCAFYDTGDSFGKYENEICLVSLQRDLKDALAIVSACEADYKEYVEDGDWKHRPLIVNLPVSGKTEEVYTGPWKGYFQSLREFKVVALLPIASESDSQSRKPDSRSPDKSQ